MCDGHSTELEQQVNSIKDVIAESGMQLETVTDRNSSLALALPENVQQFGGY